MKRKLYTKILLVPPALFVLLSVALPFAGVAPANAASSLETNCQNFSGPLYSGKSIEEQQQAFKQCMTNDGSAFGKMTIEEQVQSYIYMTMIAGCVSAQGSGLHPDAVGRWEIFDGTGRQGRQRGVWLNGTPAQNGTGNTQMTGGYRNCNEDNGGWVHGALDLWYSKTQSNNFRDPFMFICNILKATRDDGSNCVTSTTGSSISYQPADDNQARDNAFENIRKAIYKNNRWELTDAQKYVLYYNSFIIGCKVDQFKGPASELTQSEKTGYHVTSMKIVDDPAQPPVEMVYHYPDVGGFNGAFDGSDESDRTLVLAVDNYKAATTHGDITTNGCTGIAKTLSDTPAWAAAYSKYKIIDGDGAGLSATPDGAGTSDTSVLTCNNGEFDWVACPIIKAGINGITWVDGLIMDMLNVDVGPIFDHTDDKTSASYGFFTAWNSFRIIAIAVLIIAGLIMVISQALGFELLDAYTIRKTLPRLLVAIIGISLSWPLMRLVIDFFDSAGFGIRQLMYTPFQGFHGTIDFGTGILTSIIGGGMLLAMGPAVFTFLITAALGVAVAYLTLVLRQVAIIMLIIVAPVAIACYVLPNTQKIWKLWSSNFLGLMVMFPIISALIAAGHIFAAVALYDNITGLAEPITNSFASVFHLSANHPLTVASGFATSLAMQAFAIIAYFLPYFMIPTAIGWSNKLLGTAAGVLQGMTKGLNAGLSKFRGNAMAKRWNDLRSGKRFAGGTEHNMRGRINRALGAVSNVGEAGYGGLGVLSRSGRARIGSHMGTHAVDAAMEGLEKNSAMRAIKDSDDLLWGALHGGGTDAGTRAVLERRGLRGRNLEEGVAAIRAARRSMGDHSFQIAAAVAQAGTGTGYADSGEMLRTIAGASGGNRAVGGRMLAASRQLAGQGRIDLSAPSFGAQAAELGRYMESGGTYTIDTAALDRSALESADAVSVARSRVESVTNITRSASARLADLESIRQASLGGGRPLTPDEQTEMGQLTAQLQSLRNMGGAYAAPQRVQAIADHMEGSAEARVRLQERVADADATRGYSVATHLPVRQEPDVEAYREQSQRRGYDPNDPYSQP